jgi:3-deoxy-manno-octulosonate cytidylyltransferase (CMP-KDO synthetase)
MILAVIPARYASTRFPGKPLVEIKGKTMIQRVYEQVSLSQKVNNIVVATDDERIYQHVISFGGNAMMTLSSHISGSDRCSEVAQHYPDAKLILNIQGDEPFIQPEQIDLLVETLLLHDYAGIASIAKQITDTDTLFNHNVVKVVMSNHHHALYFSRSPIPFVRGEAPDNWIQKADFHKHIGLYGFKRHVLLRLATLSPTALELSESLEQLRWLSQGFVIAMGITTLETIGVDTPEDLLKF